MVKAGVNREATAEHTLQQYVKKWEQSWARQQMESI